MGKCHVFHNNPTAHLVPFPWAPSQQSWAESAHSEEPPESCYDALCVAGGSVDLSHVSFCGWCPSCAEVPLRTHTGEVLKNPGGEDAGARPHCSAPVVLVLKPMSMQNSSRLSASLPQWLLSRNGGDRGRRTKVLYRFNTWPRTSPYPAYEIRDGIFVLLVSTPKS